MTDGENKLKISDNDAINLFVSFYKLFWLGTRFADKML